jgi:hypothetical protein
VTALEAGPEPDSIEDDGDGHEHARCGEGAPELCV